RSADSQMLNLHRTAAAHRCSLAVSLGVPGALKPYQGIFEYARHQMMDRHPGQTQDLAYGSLLVTRNAAIGVDLKHIEDARACFHADIYTRIACTRQGQECPYRQVSQWALELRRGQRIAIERFSVREPDFFLIIGPITIVA